MSKNNEFVKIAIFNDTVQADIMRSLLEAQNIRVLSSKEGAGIVYALSVGSLSEIELYVPGDQEKEARAIVHEYFSGAEPDEKK